MCVIHLRGLEKVTEFEEEGTANWMNCLRQSALQQKFFSTFGHMI